MSRFFGPLRPDWLVGKKIQPDQYQDQGISARPPVIPPRVRVYSNAVYYPNWKVYDNKPPSILRADVISHIFYAFAWVKPSGEVYLSDEWADDQIAVDGVTGCIRACARLKQQYQHLRVILSVGGGGHSENFASVAADPSKRALFASSARALVDKYGIDGIDVDWEHPSTPQEGQTYFLLLQSLRQHLPPPIYTLSTALPAGQWALQHIPLAEAAQHLDIVNVMAYDFSGPWTPESGHHAQLFAAGQDDPSGARGVEYLLSRSVPASKILLGIPCYGRSFLSTSGPGQRHAGCGPDEGTLEYRDIVAALAAQQQHHHQHDDQRAAAASCVLPERGWVSYDSCASVRAKAAFARGWGLGGLFYWHGVGDVVAGAGTGGEAGGGSLVVAGYEGLHAQ